MNYNIRLTKHSIYKIVIVLLFQCLQVPVIAQITDFKVQYLLGDKTVEFQENCYNGCDTKIIYINLHDNEQTSRRVADSFLKSNSGLLFHIKNDSSRNLNFTVNNKLYTVDPNRIFSKKGRLKSLQALSTVKDAVAESYVRYLANQIVKNYIADKKMVVTLHNNSNENFSIDTYRDLADSLPGAARFYINPEMDKDDFVITTSLKIYNRIKAKKINVVWENIHVMDDDGSLSLYCSKRKIPYINLEAQHDHFNEQMQILLTIQEIIQDYAKRK